AGAGRRLDQEPPRRRRIVERLGDGIVQLIEKLRLLRPRCEAGGKVREQVNTICHAWTNGITRGVAGIMGGVPDSGSRVLFEFSACGLALHEAGRVLLFLL